VVRGQDLTQIPLIVAKSGYSCAISLPGCWRAGTDPAAVPVQKVSVVWKAWIAKGIAGLV